MIQGVCSRPSGDARGRLVKVRLYSLAGSLMLIYLQTRYFSWRARQDSNLRPSLFVVLISLFSQLPIMLVFSPTWPLND